mgnify:CR=1
MFSKNIDLPRHSWRGSNLRAAVAGFSQERSYRYNFSYKFVIFLAETGKSLVLSTAIKDGLSHLQKDI